MMTEQNKADLAQHISLAEKEGKWLWNRYHDIWFSPVALRAANAEGRFIWGAVNWELRAPGERLANLEAKARQVQRELDKARNDIS